MRSLHRRSSPHFPYMVLHALLDCCPYEVRQEMAQQPDEEGGGAPIRADAKRELMALPGLQLQAIG